MLVCFSPMIAQAQNVGLGVLNPQARLDIQSSNTNILTSAGDLRIGGNSRFLKFGVNTSSGNSFMLAQGGNGFLEIGAGTNTGVLNIRPSGAVGFSQQFGGIGQMLISRGGSQSPVWRRPPYMFIFRTNTLFQRISPTALFVAISGIDDRTFTINETSDVYFTMVSPLETPFKPSTTLLRLRITIEIWNDITNTKLLSTSNTTEARESDGVGLDYKQITTTGFIRLNPGNYRVYAYARAFEGQSTDEWFLRHAENFQDNSAFMAFQVYPVYP